MNASSSAFVMRLNSSAPPVAICFT
jgi:hypothetical protein